MSGRTTSSYLFSNINDDVLFKPHLLRDLVRKYVPSKLTYVISSIQTHGLLSESYPPSTEQAVIDTWKSEVHSWVNHLLHLASDTSMPESCCVGIRLLGLTCQECSLDRFLASYSDWFHRFITYMQQSSAETHILKAASCAALSDLLNRLARYPSQAKEGKSHATKLIQPILKLLNEDDSEVVCEEATSLLSTIITLFPSSIQRHYDTVEAAIALRLMADKCSDCLLKKLGHVLSLLPKSRGDSKSWQLMMENILLLIDDQLKDAFQGLEEESRRNKVKNLILLGGTVVNETCSTNGSGLLLISRISTLIGCCCHMLTDSCHVQVSVPIQPLLALVERVLVVDGSSSHGFLPNMELVTICSRLHLLHLNCLELLSSIIQGLSRLLLPHLSGIIQFLKVYFNRCKLPELRIKVYSVYRDLLRSMGVGVVEHLAEVITSNAELGFFDFENGVPFSSVNSASAVAQLQPCQKKRKHKDRCDSLSQQSNRVEIEVDRALNVSTVSAKIAALEALEDLLIVGGSYRSKDSNKKKFPRSYIDAFLAEEAINACKDGFMKVENTSTYTAFQLAALRAFFASLVSPGRTRGPYLTQGFELFRRGLREGGARVSDFCARSLLILPLVGPPLVADTLVDDSDKMGKDQHEAVSDWLIGLIGNSGKIILKTAAIEARTGNHPEASKMAGGSEADASANAATAKTVATEKFLGTGATLVFGVETAFSSGNFHSSNDMEVNNNVNNHESGEIAKESELPMDESYEIIDGDPDSDY